MQIIEMYEPDEDLKKQGKKSGGKKKKRERIFHYLKNSRVYAIFKILAFLVKCIFKCFGAL